MKSLLEFKSAVNEEKSDYSKFDVLVRAGLANKAQMQRIHKILDKMQEEKPVFNNTDRAILQNMFNRRVDLVSNNKQIFTQTRKAVREDINEDTSNPPFVLLLKRKAIRMYPDGTKIALYYNDKLDKYFSLPYGDGVDAPIQAEEVEVIEEAVMDQLHKIVSAKTGSSVKFGNGVTRKIDHFTASAITQVHNALNDSNKKKLSDMVHKSPEHLAKVADFAFSKRK